MSYILDALRKSEQQRQQGATPRLAGALPPLSETVAPRQIRWLPMVIGAPLVLVAGVLIGGWYFRQAAPTPVATLPTVAPTVTAPTTTTQIQPPPAIAPIPAPPPAEAPVQVAPPPPLATPPAPIATLKKIERQPAAPAKILPPIEITVHAYAADPAERLAGINGKLVREGQEISPGLRLERITEKGVQLNYQGQRFTRALN